MFCEMFIPKSCPIFFCAISWPVCRGEHQFVIAVLYLTSCISYFLSFYIFLLFCGTRDVPLVGTVSSSILRSIQSCLVFVSNISFVALFIFCKSLSDLLNFVGCHLSWYNLCQHPEVNSWFGKIKSRDIPRLTALKVELSPLMPLTTPYLF